MYSTFFFFGPFALIFVGLMSAALWSIRKWITLGGVFLIFFLMTAFLNALVINTSYHDSDLDDWMCLVGPVLVLAPFAFILYCMERSVRRPSTAAIIAGLGALPVTALWLLASTLLMG